MKARGQQERWSLRLQGFRRAKGFMVWRGDRGVTNARGPKEVQGRREWSWKKKQNTELVPYSWPPPEGGQLPARAGPWPGYASKQRHKQCPLAAMPSLAMQSKKRTGEISRPTFFFPQIYGLLQMASFSLNSPMKKWVNIFFCHFRKFP